MTQEEKARAYDEAVKKVMDYYEGKTKLYSDVEQTLDLLFPGLKESADEMIRKALIGIINNYVDNSNTFKPKMIAWLEKQCKKEYALKSSKDEDIRKFVQCIEKQAKSYDIDLPNRGYDIYGFAKDILAWLEKQAPNPQGKTALEAIHEEKVDNANKVMPKFKV